jgi:hypothetical protein
LWFKFSNFFIFKLLQGKISTSSNGVRAVSHYQLPQLAALPIYLSACKNGTMFGTELAGNNILNITSDGIFSPYNLHLNSHRFSTVVVFLLNRTRL